MNARTHGMGAILWRVRGMSTGFCAFCPELFPGAPSAVNHQRAPCDHRAFVRSKIEGRGGDFLGFRHSSTQLRRGHVAIGCFRIGVLFEPRENEWRFDSARADAIEPDA